VIRNEQGGFDLSKFRVPAGSLLVDGALVFALIYGSGQITERLEHLSRRVDAMEATDLRADASARLMVLERRADDMDAWKRDVREQLDRIEDKVNRIAEGK
jgi:hypothetical protein